MSCHSIFLQSVDRLMALSSTLAPVHRASQSARAPGLAQAQALPRAPLQRPRLLLQLRVVVVLLCMASVADRDGLDQHAVHLERARPPIRTILSVFELCGWNIISGPGFNHWAPGWAMCDLRVEAQQSIISPCPQVYVCLNHKARNVK